MWRKTPLRASRGIHRIFLLFFSTAELAPGDIFSLLEGSSRSSRPECGALLRIVCPALPEQPWEQTPAVWLFLSGMQYGMVHCGVV